MIQLTFLQKNLNRGIWTLARRKHYWTSMNAYQPTGPDGAITCIRPALPVQSASRQHHILFSGSLPFPLLVPTRFVRDTGRLETDGLTCGEVGAVEN